MATKKTTKSNKSKSSVKRQKVSVTSGTPKKRTTKKSSVRKTTSSSKKMKATIAKKGRNTKKSTTKRKQRVTTPKGKVLICADGESCFWTTDGTILKDLMELRDALQHMELSVFQNHVTKEKNDFADWVEQVLLDRDCAMALRSSRKPNTARAVVVRHLRYYNI